MEDGLLEYCWMEIRYNIVDPHVRNLVTGNRLDCAGRLADLLQGLDALSMIILNVIFDAFFFGEVLRGKVLCVPNLAESPPVTGAAHSRVIGCLGNTGPHWSREIAHPRMLRLLA